MEIDMYSTKDLVAELIKRKEAQLLDCGLYQQWQLKGKYDNHQIELPNKYQVLLLTTSNRIISEEMEWETGISY